MQRRPQPWKALGFLLGAGLFLVGWAGAGPAPAASERIIRGQVLDENDKVVATAVVHLINLSTKEQWSVVTDKEGRYQFNSVDSKADLQLYAEKGEQKSRVHTISQFDIRTRIVVNLKLNPAKKPEAEAEKKD